MIKLEDALVVLMVFMSLLCLFAIFVIVRDIVLESIYRHKEKNTDSNSVPGKIVLEVKNEPTVDKVIVKEEVETVDESTVEVKTETVDDGNSVVFSSTSLSLDEKLAMLSSEQKMFFNDIIKYALSKDDVKEIKTNNFYSYKIGSYQVLKLSIRRNEINCEFKFIDRDLINYTSNYKTKIKQQSTQIRVIEASDVGVVKDGIDLICRQIAVDKEYKKNLAREKRRQKNRKESVGA